MKQKIEKVIKNRKVKIALMELAVAIGCIITFCLFMIPKDRIPDTTHSYSKVEKVTKYKVVDNYVTRVMPLTDYETFKEIAGNTFNNGSEGKNYTIKVYSDEKKTQEVTSGYIASGMIVETTVETESKVEETTEEVAGETKATEALVGNEEEKVENATEEVSNKGASKAEENKEEKNSYTISVIGDFTKDGDINVTELTKITKCVIGLSEWNFTGEEKLAADLNGDGQIDITDIESCINYIVFGKLDIQEEKYTVTFKDYDGSIISTKTNYHYGDKIEIPENPTREADETYTYEFAGWNPEISETETVKGNAEYIATYKMVANRAKYTVEHYKQEIDGSYKLAETEQLEGTIEEKVTAVAKTYEGFTEDTENENRIAEGIVKKDGSLTLKLYYKMNQYTITFKNEDGTVISEKTDYHYGDTVTVPENPSKAENETSTYEFAGWKNEETGVIGVTEVTENANYIATYTEKHKEYTIKFKNEDGTVISEKTDYHYGDTVTVPENPSKAENETSTYEFAGWKNEETGAIGVTEVKGNANYIAIYTEKHKEYTITFKNDDGTVISEKADYHYGDTVTVPEIPTKPEDETNTYEFAGWKNEETGVIGVTEVTGNANYIATYTSRYKEYKITFKNEDGTVISEKADYHYGDTVTVPETPTKPEDEINTYEFAGWKNQETGAIGVTEVKGNANYIATYTNRYKEYTITFKNEDGTVISEKTDYHYGDIVAVPESPSKPEDETNTYEFAGWKKEGTEVIGVTEVTGNATYIATYTNQHKEYTITFEDYDGTILSQKANYHYGDTVIVPENPTREEDNTYTYEFAGWDKEVTDVKGNTTYIATYINKYKEYTITFKQDTGNVISSVIYHYGDTIEIPEDPVKESTVEKAYTFSGWTPEIEETVTKSAEYVATYEEKNIKYTFIFYNDDGVTEVARIEDYMWGDNLKLPASPTKEPTEEINYVFSEWKNLGTEEISETQKNIKFMAQYTEEYFVARLVETDTLEGTSYMTLQEAINVAGEEQRTVKLLRYTEESVLVEDVQNVTIDLNGKTITGSKTGTKAYAIKNYGTLTITDTTEEKNGMIQESAIGSVGYGIYNKEGSLTIKSGMIVTDTNVESGSTYAIYNQSEEALIIEGGTITAEARGVSSASYGIYNLSGKEITVIGGTVLGNASAESSTGYGIYNATDGIVNVAGGKVKGATSLASAVSYGIYNTMSENVTISGGMVEVKSDRGVAYGVYNEQGKVTQTGGTVDIVASTGYGFYNKKGTIDNKGGTIELNGSTMYGIYNRGTMNVTGGNIVSKTENSGYGIYNASTIDSNISNISISKTNYGIYNSQGNLTVKDVTITTNYGIRMEANKDTIVVESADIVANSYGIYCSYGTVEIGIKDGNVSTTQPNIYGETNAIYNELIKSGKVNYYDGILTGTMVIYGGINEIEDNTQIVVETNQNDKEVARLEAIPQENVVKIGDIGYSTLADAIDAVSANSTEGTNDQVLIETIKDFTISKAVEIPKGMNIKIDLAGHKVTSYGKGGITNNGTLEIVDTSNDKNAEFISRIGIGITNSGNFKISSGAITSNVYGVYNYGTGNIVIEDGTVTGSSYGIYNYNGSNTSITINGGSVTGNKYGIANVDSVNSIISVNGGSVTGNKYGMYSSSYSTDVFNVNGGSINGNDEDGIYMWSGTLNISRGTVTGKIYGVELRGGTINMTGGKVVSVAESNYGYSSGIYNYNGKINIEAGEVEGYNGINSDHGIANVIGKKDNNVNIDNPVIIGQNYGIITGVESNNLKIYDGKILGKTDAIYGSISEIEEGKRIEIGETTLNDEKYKIANWLDNTVYEDPIVRVGSNEYKSFKEMKEAINNIPTNSEGITEITILNDFYMPEELEIKNGQKIILDLNGKTITTMSKILNRGTLQITDNTEEGQGKILNSSSTAVQNSGTMTITKGTIEAKSSGIYNYNGNLTIGVEDGNVTNIPIIKSEISNGVSKSGGSVSMFDGTIIGKNTSESQIDKTEEEYKVYSYQEEGYYKTTIVELSPMARIGDVETSLVEAIALAEEGDTIEVLRNIQVKEKIVVPEDKNITIDLKGYTISNNSSATNIDAILENRGTLKLAGKNGYIINNKGEGTTIINNGTLDLLEGNIYKYYGTAVENNGVFSLKSGSINVGNGSYDSYYTVKNTAEFNMLGGSIYTSTYGNGIINEKGATFTMKAGYAYGHIYAIYNNSDNEMNISGGYISHTYIGTSSSYAIYNNADANINIEGVRINSDFRYGVYNNANGDITVSNKTNISIGDSNYGYGVYNNGTGNITISAGANISASGKFGYGAYNNGSGNLTIEASTISVNGTNQAYGIMNANQGRIEIANGNINVESNSGYAYGVQNGVLGTATIERANIIVNTTEGKSYGINNESKSPFAIKEGIIRVTGEQSTGVYSSASNIILGNDDESITTEVPVIQSDNIGIYINEVDAKFNFYDGKVMGKIPFNTGANTVEGYKIIQYYDGEEKTNVAIPVETDNYVLTYYLNGEKYSSDIIKEGQQINVLMPEIEEGYEFTGWKGVPEVMPGEDINIYGTLTPKTYTITYYVDGEQYGEVDTFEYKSNVTPKEVPTKEGHEFSGWSEKPETMPAENIEVRGVFTYTATFYNEDKTSVISTVDFTVNDESIIEPEVPGKEGYVGYWSQYEIKAEDLEIQLVYVENKAVINKTKATSYDNIETAMEDIDKDGTKNEIFLTQDVIAESTITVPENANVVLDLNGYTITNNSTYCGIDNYGTIELVDNSQEQTGTLVVEKADADIYGIYNRENANAIVRKGKVLVTATSGYTGIGIYNNSGVSLILGTKDNNVSTTNPSIQASTYGIKSDSNAILKFYDGKIEGTTAIEENISEVEYGYRTVSTTNSETNLQVCYLEKIPNGTKLTAKDQNGIIWNYTYQDGQATNVYYESGELGETVTIPYTLAGYPVASLHNSGLYYGNIFAKSFLEDNATVKEVLIPDSVKSIGYYAFYKCSALENINIPNSVTNIEATAFSKCSNLKKLTVSSDNENFSSEENILYNKDKTKLISCAGGQEGSITIPNTVNIIEACAFGGCNNLKNIIIQSSITNIKEYAFEECSTLTDIYINNKESDITFGYNWKKDTYAYVHFNDCKHKIIKEIETGLQVEEINTNVQDGTIACGENYQFKVVNEQGEVVTNKLVEVVSKGEFTNSYNVNEGVISSNEEGIYTIENIKRDKTIRIGHINGYRYQATDENEITWSYVYQDGQAETVYYKSGTLGEIVTIPSTLDGYPVVELNYYPGYPRYDSIFAEGSRTEIKKVIIPEGVTTIGGNAFEGCRNLTSIDIPESVTSIGWEAFYGCTSLSSINIPEGVTSIGERTFRDCSSLSRIEIPSSVTSIGNDAFYNCSSLTDIHINNLQPNLSLGDNWKDNKAYVHYSDCKHTITKEIKEEGLQIQDVSDNLENGKIECGERYQFKLVDESGEVVKDKIIKVASQGEFINSADKEYWIFPEKGIYTIENVTRDKRIIDIIDLNNGMSFKSTDSNGITWNYTYEDGTATNVYYESGELIAEVNIPDNLDGYPVVSLYNSELQEYGNIFVKNRYTYNTTIQKVNIPATVVSIGYSAFYNCTSLNTINIPEKVESIGSYAFEGCRSLTSIEIPSSVTSIGSGAFGGCHGLTIIELPNSIANIGYRAFENCNNLADIYVDNVKDNVTSDFDYMLKSATSTHIHYNDCKHSIKTSINSKLNLRLEEVNSNVENNTIQCGEDYKFKILNEAGEIVTDEKVIVKSQGKFINSRITEEEITSNEEGIYTIENVTRNKLIIIGKEFQATDENGITWNYRYKNGEAVNVYYESGEISEIVNIPSTLDGYPVVSLYNSSEERNIFAKLEDTYDDIENRIIAERKMDGNQNNSVIPIKEIIIPNSVRVIGNNAFEICANLEKINMPNDITEIGDFAFFGCISLTDIKIPENTTSIGRYAFGCCKGLTTVTIPEKVTNIEEYAFIYCKDLTDIYVNNIESNVAYAEEWNTYEKGDLKYTVHYSDCKHEIQVENSSRKDLQIQEIGTNLEDGKIECKGTYQFKLVNKEGEIVSNEKVTLTSYKRVNDSEEIIEEITPNEEGIYTIENINRNFKIIIGILEGTNLEATDDNGITWNYTYSENTATNVRYSSGTLGETVEIPSELGGIPVVSLGYEMLSTGNTVVAKVVIPEGVTSIGSYAFSECTSLSSITIPDSVTDIERYAFGNTAWYNNQPDGVVYVGKIAYDYKGTMPENTTIQIKEGTTKIQSNLFDYEVNLVGVEIPDSVTSIGDDAFNKCTNLRNVTMSKNIKYIGSAAFGHCTSLENIVIWKDVNELGYRTFDGWEYNQTINIEANEIPEGWDENWNYQCNAIIIYGYTGE